MADDSRARDRHSIEFLLDGTEIGYYCNKFEWVCFINGGHRVTASFKDTHEDSLNIDGPVINRLLEKAKKEGGIDVEVRIWQDYRRKEGKKTAKRKFKVLTVNSYLLGSITDSVLELVCIDAPSWLLNQGKCNGKAYQGKIGGDNGAIAQIVREYAEGISVKVDDTEDNEKNWWWDLRLDPKTIISSLIEWSSSITNEKTPLVVHCQDNEFKCREWTTLPPTKTNGKKFYVSHKKGFPQEWTNRGELQILSNNLLSPAATRLYTGSISAVTGLYIDKGNAILEKKQRWADDETTGSKLGPIIQADQGYKKPRGESGTFIEPVPEHNNGDVGIPYQDYSVGRARDWFIKTIYTTMRVKITIEPGDTDFDDIYACGRDKINLQSITLEEKPYYINGPWLLYGFRHLCDWEHWKTELLLSRIEHDAEKRPI